MKLTHRPTKSPLHGLDNGLDGALLVNFNPLLQLFTTYLLHISDSPEERIDIVCSDEGDDNRGLWFSQQGLDSLLGLGVRQAAIAPQPNGFRHTDAVLCGQLPELASRLVTIGPRRVNNLRPRSTTVTD